MAHKRRHGLVDFDDLLLLWRAALADPAAGPALRGLFDAVLVDEYQDVNAVQAEIVRLLRPDGSGLTCVGDDAQAIYAFRGADPAHLRALAGAYPGLAVVRLVRNYRSRDSVLRLANVVRPQSAGLELELTGVRGAGPPPQLVRCHDEATQAREIVRPGAGGARGRAPAAGSGGAGPGGAPQRRARGRAVGPRHPVREVRRAAVHRGRARQGLPGRGAGGGQPGRRHRLVPGAAAARGHRAGARPADDRGAAAGRPGSVRPLRGRGARRSRPGPAPRWRPRCRPWPPRPAWTASADRAGAILAALDGPLRVRYPDAAVRIADLERLADAAASRPSLHDALVELALDPPVSASDLAGRPRLDDDFLIISTVHSAKGLEWPVVHLPHLVDGAVPSDMALSTPAGLAEERRLFYVAVTRARDELYLYAPLRLHHHRTGRDDRHGYGQLSRFLDARAPGPVRDRGRGPARAGGAAHDPARGHRRRGAGIPVALTGQPRSMRPRR